MFTRLERVAVKHPQDAFRSQDHLDAHWNEFGFLACPDFDQACRDMDRFARQLSSRGADIVWISAEDGENVGLDSIYVHDPVFTLAEGLVECRMGKPQRQNEPSALAGALTAHGMPVLGRISAPGRMEGGDIIWLDPRRLAVAEGYRTNAEGIRQLRHLAANRIDDIVRVPLPHWEGKDHVLHLMSVISPVAPDVAVVYSRLLPVPFRALLLDSGIRLIEVPDEEYATLGCNVLALEPGVCLMADGNPATRSALEAAGCEVLTYPGREISLLGSGGPTCLTRPLVRA